MHFVEIVSLTKENALSQVFFFSVLFTILLKKLSTVSESIFYDQAILKSTLVNSHLRDLETVTTINLYLMFSSVEFLFT